LPGKRRLAQCYQEWLDFAQQLSAILMNIDTMEKDTEYDADRIRPKDSIRSRHQWIRVVNTLRSSLELTSAITPEEQGRLMSLLDKEELLASRRRSSRSKAKTNGVELPVDDTEASEHEDPPADPLTDNA
jgi:hypothetical protein